MEIIVAKRAGFCFGVKRAVELAQKEAESPDKRVFTLGPIIHNPQVIKRLSETGVRPLEEPTDEADAVIIRTHGVPRNTLMKLKEKNIEVIDATCPFVKKAQQYADSLKRQGYQVVILGEKEHPEVKGIYSYAGEDAIIVKTPEELPQRISKKIGIVVQTTQPVDALRRLVEEIVGRVKKLKVYNTICNSTALRIKETREIARMVDAMVVVGGRNSANTRQLAKYCCSVGVTTYHIEEAGELKREMFQGLKRVGVTAGASTPDWIIQEVVQKLREF